MPLLIFQIIYSIETRRLQYLSFVGMTVHLTSLLLAARHWIAARHDPGRRFVIFHPGTCLELKERMTRAPKTGQTLPSEPDGRGTGDYDLYLSTRKPRRRPRPEATETPETRVD